MLVPTLLLFPLLSAATVHHRHDHSHRAAKRLPSTWYHDEDHPVHSLFKRGGATDGAVYAAVGSDEWQKAFPPGPPSSPDPQGMPAEWTAALNDAIARKAIPDIPVATDNGDDNPTYSAGNDPNSPQICSATYQCRIPGDIWDAPDGYLGISFDDGPLPASDALLTFLQSKNQPVTHFMIGSNIIFYPDEFKKSFDQGDDIAVHTWTHPHMTTRSNLQVVAELGWTMEAIHNSTGGRVPKFWRPPYGDSDVRTSAIAKEVFGLTTIIWNQDTEDWSLTSGGTTPQAVNSSMTKWLTGPKSPGLIILEHELSDESVKSFISAYPVMQQNNWKLMSLAQLVGNNTAYQNSPSNTGPVNQVNVINAKNGAPPAGGDASASAAASGSAAAGKSSNTYVAPVNLLFTASSASPAGSVGSSTPSSAASSQWERGSTAILSVAILFMLWT
ncbi:carbohydrate esterase family 4 protein [Mycena crocata]|nr:carbohydrate esterase family 4 protein [Mycena crocata]